MSTDTSSEDTTAVPLFGDDVPARRAQQAKPAATDGPRSTEARRTAGQAGTSGGAAEAAGPGTPPGGGTPGSTPPGWQRTARWWAPPLALLLVAAAWVGWLMYDRAGTAMPGVTLEGVDVGGMDAAAMKAQMDAIVTRRQDAVITAAAAGQTFTMQMGTEGYQADVDGAVAAALAAGRDGPIGSVVTHVQTTLGDRTWDLTLETDTIEAPVDEFVAMVGDTVDVDPFPGSVTLDPETATVTSELPATGLELDRETARELVLGVAGIGQDATVDLPTVVLEPATEDADVTAAVSALETALAEPYRLTRGDDAVTIEPTEFAQWLSVADPEEAFAVTLDEAALAVAMEGRGARFDVEPVSARYVIESGWRTYDNKGSGTFDPSPASVSIVEGRNGLSYDAESATQQVLALYEAGEHTAELELDVVEPRLSNDRAQQLRPNALLGTFTTYEACCGNRQHNIRRLADLVDGAMLLPGENYSVNDEIGPRTEEKGFLPAGAIIAGEIDEEDVGGGISQTATTFYNAAFFAGIEVLEHRPHSWPISRYPLGREATFDYGSDLDINILNNTEHAIIVSTSWADESVTFSIFGFDDGRRVTAEMGSPYDYRDYPTERRPNPDLPPGVEQVVQTGGQGFSVDYTRIIEGGVAPGTENYSWTYSPKAMIIEYGPE
jgi:vancomycin resistance protein YoaR